MHGDGVHEGFPEHEGSLQSVRESQSSSRELVQISEGGVGQVSWQREKEPHWAPL